MLKLKFKPQRHWVHRESQSYLRITLCRCVTACPDEGRVVYS